MRKEKIIILVIMICAFGMSPLYAASKKDNPGEGKKPEKILKIEKIDKGKKIGNFKKQLKLDIEQNLRQDIRQNFLSPPSIKNPAPAEQKRLLLNLDQALNKLQQARWFYNPNDDRGQGNMSKNEMIAPFGHDKDSDRKEVYGNRGRVVRLPEPQPEPTPEPQPEPVPEPTPQPDPIPIPPPLPMSIR